MDRFFDGAFLTFGLEVIAFAEQDQEDRLDPLIYVFPRMTKCTFHKFGTSGEVEKHDALCLLPLNIVNEKVYIFLWFWFILLTVLSFLVIVYRFIIVISPKMRAYLLYIRFRLIRREVINTIVKKSYVGDWFLFYMLGKSFYIKKKSLIKEFRSDILIPNFSSYKNTKNIWFNHMLYIAFLFLPRVINN